MILVTGGAGFIGANFVLDWLAAGDEPVLNVDKLTYAGNLKSLESLQGDARHVFVQADIGDGQTRSEEHTSELQSHSDLVCRLLLEKKNTATRRRPPALPTA